MILDRQTAGQSNETADCSAVFSFGKEETQYESGRETVSVLIESVSLVLSGVP